MSDSGLPWGEILALAGSGAAGTGALFWYFVRWVRSGHVEIKKLHKDAQDKCEAQNVRLGERIVNLETRFHSSLEALARESLEVQRDTSHHIEETGKLLRGLARHFDLTPPTGTRRE